MDKYAVRVDAGTGMLVDVGCINAETVDDAVAKFWKHLAVAKVWSWSITDSTMPPTREFLHSREDIAEMKTTGAVYTQKVGESWKLSNGM